MTTTTEVPTGLKELIAACEKEVEGFKYSFQKKPELTEMLVKARAETPAPKAEKKAEKKETAAAPVKTGKKETKKADVELPDPEDEEEVEEEGEEIGEEVEEESEEEEVKDTKSKKTPKKAAEPKAEKAKKALKPEDDIEEIKKRTDVIAIMENAEYTKSDKIRKLFQKSKLTVGNIAKLLGLHYSFAYCVVDAFRKAHLNDEKKPATKAKAEKE